LMALIGFVFGQTKALRSAFYTSGKGTIATLHDKTIIPLTAAVYQLRLSSDEQSILVALSDGNLLSFSVVDIMEKV
jgi:tricorn protease-like protein